MTSFLWICMNCGQYLKGTPAIMVEICEKHLCNLSAVQIKQNVNECKAIVGTLGEDDPNASMNDDSTQTTLVLRPTPPLPNNQKEKEQIMAVSLNHAKLKVELKQKLEDRVRQIKEAETVGIKEGGKN